jgi:hypothetical protein
MSIANTAIEYLRMGMSVIPVGKDKKALIPWRDFQKVRPTEEQVEQWFTSFPHANIAIITGQISDLTVIDCDSQAAVDSFASQYSGRTPCVKTPKGMHFYFKYLEGSRNGARVLTDTDIRSEGGYVVAPPSSNGDGIPYEWVYNIKLGCDSISTTYSFISLLAFTRAQGSESLNTAESQRVQLVTTSHDYYIQGRRDEDIFHAANCLVKGNAEPDFIKKTLEILSKSCNPPFPDKDIEAKIQSALDRAGRRQGTLTEELKWWIESQTGQWRVTDWYHESHIVTKQEKHATIQALKRFCIEGLIESCGERSGNYRNIDKTDNEQQWWLDEGKPLPIKFPLGVENFAKVYQGNIILLEGQKSQGKSTFSFEFARLNKGLYPGITQYQNIEMVNSEIKERFKSYEDEGICTQGSWREHLKIIKQTSDWHDKIIPDGINIIDYLLEYDKPFILPRYIFAIHKKLTTGIALVSVQRDPYKPYPTGGRGVRDIPRLCLSLINHEMRIEDAKSFWPTDFGNPTGMSIKYKQIKWCKWISDGTWDRTEERKYAQFK